MGYLTDLWIAERSTGGPKADARAEFSLAPSLPRQRPIVRKRGVSPRLWSPHTCGFRSKRGVFRRNFRPAGLTCARCVRLLCTGIAQNRRLRQKRCGMERASGKRFDFRSVIEKKSVCFCFSSKQRRKLFMRIINIVFQT